MGLFMAAKILFLLVVSFFILLSITKIKSKKLQQFGRLLAVSIWILSAFMVLNLLTVTLYDGGCKKSKKMGYKKMHQMKRANFQHKQ